MLDPAVPLFFNEPLLDHAVDLSADRLAREPGYFGQGEPANATARFVRWHGHVVGVLGRGRIKQKGLHRGGVQRAADHDAVMFEPARFPQQVHQAHH